MIGPYATSFPWDRVSDDPLGRFLELRDGVRLEVACAIPLRARPREVAAGRRVALAGGHQASTDERARSGDH